MNIHEVSVFHPNLSIKNGAVDFWRGRYADYQVSIVKTAMAYYGVPITDQMPLKEYQPEQKAILFHRINSKEVQTYFPDTKPPRTVAEGKFEGILTGMWRRFSEKSGENAEAESYFYSQTCPDCHGNRLNQISRNVSVENRTIPELVNHSLEEMLQ